MFNFLRPTVLWETVRNAGASSAEHNAKRHIDIRKAQFAAIDDLEDRLSRPQRPASRRAR